MTDPAGENPRVLVVDDESAIREYLLLGLPYEGFSVQAVGNAEAARHIISEWDPQVVLLDVMMPGTDGFTLGQELVERLDRVVIFLTARDDVEDRVRGLELGADDYLVKPFAFKELVARIRRHLRRQTPLADADLRVGPVVLNHARHRVTMNDQGIELSPREFDLLYCFMQHPGQVLSKTVLLDRVWGYAFAGDSNIVEVYVGQLRDKLGDHERRLLQTVRGVGYRLGN